MSILVAIWIQSKECEFFWTISNPLVMTIRTFNDEKSKTCKASVEQPTFILPRGTGLLPSLAKSQKATETGTKNQNP
jgi:hypothetical protein